MKRANRFNKLVAMVLLVNFLCVFTAFDVAMAFVPVQPNTYNQAVGLNQPNATPNNLGLTPKVQNAGTVVIDKTTTGVQNVGTGLKNFWNNLT